MGEQSDSATQEAENARSMRRMTWALWGQPAARVNRRRWRSSLSAGTAEVMAKELFGWVLGAP